MKWLKYKYITKKDDKNILAEELRQFEECHIFDEHIRVAPQEVLGMEIVTMKGE